MIFETECPCCGQGIINVDNVGYICPVCGCDL